MQYKKSTSTVGFKSRNTPNEAKDLASKAKALDKQRISQVKEYAAVSSDQLKELQRIDTLSTKADNYEIKNLQQFNKAFTGLIDTAATEIGGSYIEAKNQEGIDLYRAYEAGDEEAKSIIDGNEEQIKDLEESLLELQRSAEAKGQELDKLTLDDKRASLEDKLRALNIRKLGTNVAYGFSKASLQASGEGFMNWFMTATRERTDQIPGEDFTVADYDNLTEYADQKKVEDFLMNEYIDTSNENIGASSKLVQKHLTSTVVKQLNTWRNNKFADEEANFAEQQIDGWNTNVIVNAKEFNLVNANNLTTSIDTLLTLGSSAHFRKGVKGSSNVANKSNLISTVEKIFAEVEDEETREDLRDYFFGQKFNIKGLGNKTLGDHYPLDFNIDDVISQADVKIANKKNQDQQLYASRFKNESEQLKEKYDLGEITEAEFNKNIDGLLVKFTDLGWYGIDGEYKNLVQYVPTFFSPTKSVEIASEEIGDITNISKSLSLDTYRKLHPSVRDKYRDSVDFEQFINTNDGINLLAGMKETIESQMEMVYVNKALNPSIKSKDRKWQLASEHAVNRIYPLALSLQKQSNEEQPIEYFMQEANKMILAEIASARTNNESTYFINSDGNFTDNLIQQLDITPESTVQQFKGNELITKQRLAEVYKTIHNTNGDAFSMEGVQLFGEFDADPILNKEKADKYLQPRLNDDDQIVGVNSDFMTIQGFDPYDRDAYTLLNKVRKSYGLKAIDFRDALPNPVIEMQKKLFKAGVETRRLLKRGDMLSKARGLDKLGLTDLRTMHNSILAHIPTDLIINGPEAGRLMVEMGINQATYKDNPLVQQQVVRYKVNKLMKKAAGLTDNKHILIRMVATEFNGGDMINWYKSTNDKIGNKVLNSYITGNTDGITGNYEDGQVNAVDHRRVNYSVEEIKTLKTPNNTETLKGQLESLTTSENIPDKFIPRLFDAEGNEVEEGGKPKSAFGMTDNKFNPKWEEWKLKTDSLKSQVSVIDNLKTDNIAWGVRGHDGLSTSLIYDVRQVIGDDRYEAILEEADRQYTGSFNRKNVVGLGLMARKPKGVFDYANIVKGLLLEQEEFFIGDE